MIALDKGHWRRSVRPVLALLVLAGASRAPAQTCPANVPHVDGQWATLSALMPINPISATLLHDGRVLIIAGSENDASNNAKGAESYRNAIWDPAAPGQAAIAVQNIEYDVFCSGTAALPDGRALIVGGTSDYSFTGESRASVFDPVTTRFVQSERMADGRWYATATALGDGRIMAFSGLGSAGGTNKNVEIYDLTSAGVGWTNPVAAPFTPPLYPRLALLPSGKVFFTGQGSGTRTTNSWLFDPAARTWTVSAATTRNRTYGSGVLLPLVPPAYVPRIVYFGGGNPATSSTELIDLSATSPAWTPGPSMSTGRTQMNAVILPNGKVLAEGGSVNNESPDGPGTRADLYDPATNAFTSGGTASYSRLYHSTAFLLPDATVVSMGSNPGSRGSYQPAIEIYTPAYLFDANDQLVTANRPAIVGVTPSSGALGYNAPFSVSYTSASPIASAVLVRPGSATHGVDMEARLVVLCGASPAPACTGAGTLALRTPPNGNVAPPGYYMLFLLDGAGVPSTARFLQLSLRAGTPPTGTIASPALDTTIPAGGSVSFGTNTVATNYSWVFPGGTPATSVAKMPGSVTFTTPGTYVASLTVLDGSGNSDPSPPTRTITVTPPTPDFDVAVTPSAVAVVPGQAATFTVTVTPESGFTGVVSLAVGSESGFPGGITSGGFTPATITRSGSATLRMNTAASALPYALSLTVTGTSGTLVHTASTTLLVNLAAPGTLTATPGNGQVALAWPASTGATTYHVKRARTAGGPYVTVGCTAATSYVDTDVANGTTYYYVVSAGFTGGPNAGGESPNSVETVATPGGVATVLCGNTGPTAGFDSGDAGILNGPPCTTGANAAGYAVVDCNAWIGTSSAGANVKCALYTDGQAKLCESAGVPVNVSNGNQRIPLSSCPTLAPNTRYWVAFNTDDGALTWGSLLANACGGAAGDSRWRTTPCGVGCQASQPDPWGAVAGPCRFRMYLTLRPLAAGTTTTTVATTTSSTTTTSLTTSTTSTTTSTTTTTTSSTTTTTLATTTTTLATTTTTVATTTTSVTTTTATTTTSSSTTSTTSSTTSTTTTTTLPPGQALPSWGADMLAFYGLNGGGAKTAGTCPGTACDLTAVNGASFADPSRQEGTASLLVSSASTAYAKCALGTCTALRDVAGDLTWGAWLQPSSFPHTINSWVDNESDSTRGGFFANVSNRALRCGVCDAGGSCVDVGSGVTKFSAGTWTHAVCTYARATTAVTTFADGAADGAPTATRALAASTATNFTWGNDLALYAWDGWIDEAFLYAGTMPAPSICRITHCGVRGEKCLCDGTTPTRFRACATNAECGPEGLCTGGACTGRSVGCSLATFPCNQLHP